MRRPVPKRGSCARNTRGGPRLSSPRSRRIEPRCRPVRDTDRASPAPRGSPRWARPGRGRRRVGPGACVRRASPTCRKAVGCWSRPGPRKFLKPGTPSSDQGDRCGVYGAARRCHRITRSRSHTGATQARSPARFCHPERVRARPLKEGCRVDPGGCPPGPPTDPDVRNSRIRLFRHMDSLRGGRPSRTCWPKVLPAQLSDAVLSR